MNWKKNVPALFLSLLLIAESFNALPALAEKEAALSDSQIEAEETLEGYTLPDGRPSLYVLKEGEESPFLSEGMKSVSDNRYQDENVCITITQDRYEVYTDVNGKQTRSSAAYYLADIYIRDITCMQRVYANNKFGNSSAKIAKFAEDTGAFLVTNGDYACELSQGVVIANGIVKRKNRNQKRDMCVIGMDGTMSIIPYGTTETYSQMIAKDILQEGAVWQLFLFGPALLDGEGNALTYAEINKKTSVATNNPRTILGYYEPGHYCLVVCDGRQGSSLGWRLEAAAQFMSELGCKQAYNLDGGQSSQMWFGGAIINKPYKNGRKVNDVLIITSPIQE